jgi:hypothetical protein
MYNTFWKRNNVLETVKPTHTLKDLQSDLQISYIRTESSESEPQTPKTPRTPRQNAKEGTNAKTTRVRAQKEDNSSPKEEPVQDPPETTAIFAYYADKRHVTEYAKLDDTERNKFTHKCGCDKNHAPWSGKCPVLQTAPKATKEKIGEMRVIFHDKVSKEKTRLSNPKSTARNGGGKGKEKETQSASTEQADEELPTKRVSGGSNQQGQGQRKNRFLREIFNPIASQNRFAVLSVDNTDSLLDSIEVKTEPS